MSFPSSFKEKAISLRRTYIFSFSKRRRPLSPPLPPERGPQRRRISSFSSFEEKGCLCSARPSAPFLPVYPACRLTSGHVPSTLDCPHVAVLCAYPPSLCPLSGPVPPWTHTWPPVWTWSCHNMTHIFFCHVPARSTTSAPFRSRGRSAEARAAMGVTGRCRGANPEEKTYSVSKEA